jgi:drug/metabolite transporter (DMT)-like permease
MEKYEIGGLARRRCLCLGYILLILATLSWSFVGILVKTASTMVDSSIITFCRFFFGIVFLGLLLLIKDRRIGLRSNLKWIWIGALGKSFNYFFENIAITIGFSYGNILVPPIQTVTLLIISTLFFKESVSKRGWTAAALCIFGVLFISWNGQPLDLIVKGSGLTTLLFGLSAIGASVHVLSQKMLLKDMDGGNMNFSVFFWASLMMALPIPIQSGGITGPVTGWAWAALGALGLITGLSFYWFTEAIRRVAFPVAIIISNSSVLFTILWSYLFYKDPISGYILVGTLIFIIGLLVLNMPLAKSRVKVANTAGN